jgi:hypothetical protein
MKTEPTSERHIRPMPRSAAQAQGRVPAWVETVRSICNLNWKGLDAEDLTQVAWAYYHFSVQFRENLEIARALYPDDRSLEELDRGERDTDNLSPWPGIAVAGERMHHDEFMRRALGLAAIDADRRRRLETLGEHYLASVRAVDRASRALSIATYEDGGLEAVFRSFLTAPAWDTPLLQAFRHFLTEHIRFDSDAELGHGALCRHLKPDDRVVSLWMAFRQSLVEAAPALLAR